jgi:hypothetical protein
VDGEGEGARCGGGAADDGSGRAVGRGHRQAGRQAALGDREGVDGAVAGQQERLIRLVGRGGGQHADAVDQRAAVGGGRAQQGDRPGLGQRRGSRAEAGQQSAGQQ